MINVVNWVNKTDVLHAAKSVKCDLNELDIKENIIQS